MSNLGHSTERHTVSSVSPQSPISNTTCFTSLMQPCWWVHDTQFRNASFRRGNPLPLTLLQGTVLSSRAGVAENNMKIRNAESYAIILPSGTTNGASGATKSRALFLHAPEQSAGPAQPYLGIHWLQWRFPHSRASHADELRLQVSLKPGNKLSWYVPEINENLSFS